MPAIETGRAPMAVNLGLKPPPLTSGATVPRRVVILDVLYADGTSFLGTWFTLEEGTTAIGSRRQTGCPVATARGTSGFHVHQSGLGDRLPDLMDKRLACDCGLEEVCEADILAGLVFEACVHQPHNRRDGKAAGCQGEGSCWHGVVCRAGSGCQGGASDPEPWFKDFHFPMIKDLINQSPFTDYVAWRGPHQGSIAPADHSGRPLRYGPDHEDDTDCVGAGSSDG